MFKLSRRTTAVAVTATALAAGGVSWAATSADAATSHPAAASASGLVPRCTPSDLAVWVNANSADGAAGTIWYHLEFTNTSHSMCHLYSWPGVSALSSGGQQLGPAAVRTGSVPATYVNIPAGGTAHSVFGYVDAQISKSCKPALATHLKVFPPDDTTAKDAFFAAAACTKNVKDLVVWRVQPGI
jgi:hypothetical protein